MAQQAPPSSANQGALAAGLQEDPAGLAQEEDLSSASQEAHELAAGLQKKEEDQPVEE